jgi:hypothetical protein
MLVSVLNLSELSTHLTDEVSSMFQTKCEQNKCHNGHIWCHKMSEMVLSEVGSVGVAVVVCIVLLKDMMN